MAKRYNFYKDVLPFTAMVVVQFTNVGIHILFKAATLKGLSYYVFIAYYHVLATLLCLPLIFIFPSRAVLPQFKFHLFSKIFLLGLIGISTQLCLYKGIEYSSPTLASAISNLYPAFTLILAVLFRLERLALRSSTSQAKILGTIVSITGALVVVLYKGPKVLLLELHSNSSESNWVIGGILLAVSCLLFSFWYIIQKQVMQMYPAELIVTFCFLCPTIIAIPVCLIAEPDLSSWMLTTNISVIAILYSAVFSTLGVVVLIWVIHLKGPLYAVIFNPVSIAVAAFMSAIFLGESLHIGSIIGAVIICMGFYAVIWGKAKEERAEDESGLSSLLGTSSSTGKVPLLQSHGVEDM